MGTLTRNQRGYAGNLGGNAKKVKSQGQDAEN